MGMKSDSEEELKKRFKDLCSDLNLDKSSADEAWNSYQRIGINYTLEVCFDSFIYLLYNLTFSYFIDLYRINVLTPI